MAYVKNDGSNLNALTNVLKYVVKFEILGLKESFQQTCFGHCFPKHANMPQLMTKFVRT